MSEWTHSVGGVNVEWIDAKLSRLQFMRPKKIVKLMEAEGVKGLPTSQSFCVIAKYLEKDGNCFAQVGRKHYSVHNREGVCIREGEWGWKMRRFLRRFDKGHYPNITRSL